MSDENKLDLSPPIIHAIEDAVLLGNVQEIAGILDLVRDDENFPRQLRYGLEALMYFRMYYGRGSEGVLLSEEKRSKLAAMESAWGRELIESIGHYPDLTEARYA